MNINFLNMLIRWNNGIERGAKSKLAETLGITRSIVGLWVTDKQKPGEVNIRKMAQIFGISESDI